MRPNLNSYIHYKKHIGIDGLFISGDPGTGKSNLLQFIIYYCVRDLNENVVYPGDIYCEWRHLIQYDIFNEIVIIVPKGYPIHYDIPKNVHRYIKEIDYEELQINDFFPENTTKKLVIVYDAHNFKQLYHQRIDMWGDIFSDLLKRIHNKLTGFILPFNEAGVYFQQSADGDHWNAVKNFKLSFVDARKAYVRLIILSQIPNEIDQGLRAKCPIRIWKNGATEKMVSEAIKKRVPYLKVNEFVIGYGIRGRYELNNDHKKFPEVNKEWRMIPLNKIEKVKNGKTNDRLYRGITTLYESGFSQKQLADIFDYSQQRVSQIINNN